MFVRTPIPRDHPVVFVVNTILPSGAIPAALGGLPALQELRLYKNQLSGERFSVDTTWSCFASRLSAICRFSFLPNDERYFSCYFISTRVTPGPVTTCRQGNLAGGSILIAWCTFHLLPDSRGVMVDGVSVRGTHSTSSKRVSLKILLAFEKNFCVPFTRSGVGPSCQAQVA